MLAKPTERIVSIDIFRGLTIMVMIFVNELAGVHGLPWWTYHAHAMEDRMTYVDMVFPFFLFIVGMSMPLAVTQRLKKNSFEERAQDGCGVKRLCASLPLLWWHVFSRAAGLIILGLILANAEKADAQRMAINGDAWALMGLFSGILFWLAPSRDPQKALVFRVLRYAGLALLIAAYAIFRSATGWIDGSYPEILGLIGYTYLAASILYLATRRWVWAPFGWFLILSASCAVLTASHAHVPLPLYFWPFDTGAMASITMAGVVVSTIFFGNRPLFSFRAPSIRTRSLLAVGFGVVTIVAAWLLTPLGISKIRATPTWCLYSIGAATLAFTALYLLCDVMKKRRWAAVVHPAGENTLLTYLLPDLYYFITAVLGFTYLDTHFREGAAGVLKALVFTVFILAISGLLTRLRIRLQL